MWDCVESYIRQSRVAGCMAGEMACVYECAWVCAHVCRSSGGNWCRQDPKWLFSCLTEDKRGKNINRKVARSEERREREEEMKVKRRRRGEQSRKTCFKVPLGVLYMSWGEPKCCIGGNNTLTSRQAAGRPSVICSGSTQPKPYCGLLYLGIQVMVVALIQSNQHMSIYSSGKIPKNFEFNPSVKTQINNLAPKDTETQNKDIDVKN